MYYVYILISKKDNNFYVGQTNDLKSRLRLHQSGQVMSTKLRLPLQLVCYEAYLTRTEAMIREKFLKSSDGRKDLRKRIKINS